MIKTFFKNRSFTLIGMIVTVTVVIIISFILLLSLQSIWAKFRDGKRAAELNNLKAAFHLYYMDYGAYPNHDADWCSLEANESTGDYEACAAEAVAVNSLIKEMIAPYLSEEMTGDPLFPQTSSEFSIIYSYRYKTINSGGEYKIYAILEKGGYYQIYSGGGFVITIPGVQP